MRVLGIESTCDESAASVVADGKTILSNVVSSQMDLHKTYGGVVPELACRRHVDLIMPVIEQALSDAKCTLSDIDLISVARGPGLIGALMIGLNAAKALSYAAKIPFVGVNHIEAHLYASLMSTDTPIQLPALGVILSGGHTTLALINNLGEYEIIGETVDDAIGEAFDKCAKMMGLPYPGGPVIEKLALTGEVVYPFKGGQVKGSPLSFSFSGLKTAVLYTLQKIDPLTDQDKRDIAASFQHAAFSDVKKKIEKALDTYSLSSILIGGGVTQSKALRKYLESFNVYYPRQELTLDNAAMIAGLGYHKYRGKSDPFDLPAVATLPLVLNPSRM